MHSKLSGVELGVHKVAEVILGCVMGLLVTWLMSWLAGARTSDEAGSRS